MDPAKGILPIPMVLGNQPILEAGFPPHPEDLADVEPFPPAETQVLIAGVPASASHDVQNQGMVLTSAGVKGCRPDCLCNMIPLVANHQPTARLDVEEIYQVLGRDILRSSLLEDIDLYLECDEDSVYAVPIKASQKIHKDNPGSLQTLKQPGSFPALSHDSDLLSTVEGRDRRYKCPLCDRTFTRPNLVKDHRSKVHGESNLFPCPLCSYQGKTSRHFKKHLTRAHNGNNKYSTEKSLLNQTQYTSKHLARTTLLESHNAQTYNIAKSILCARQAQLSIGCSAPSPELNSCQTDRGEQVPSEDPGPLTSPDTVIIEARKGVVQNIPIPGTDCYIVTQVIDGEQTLQTQGDNETLISRVEHTSFVSASDNQKFSCALCAYQCDSSHLLKRHQNTVHNADREVHCCDKCGCTFKQRRSLDSHMKGHLGQFDFQCEICDKKFASRDHLRLHSRTHIQTRTFTCRDPSCGQTFRTGGHLRQHERTVHAQRVFCCPAEGCDKSFTVRHLAAAHYKVHTGAFRCLRAGCGRTFRDAHNLRAHQKTHPDHNTTGQ